MIDGDDGLPADEVGAWTKEKHLRLRRYLDISRGARKKFLTGASRSATFIDLFCASGRARVKETGEWIDGSAVAAWKDSLARGAAFSQVFVADIDPQLRQAAVERLRRLGAPVVELSGSAVEAVGEVTRALHPYGLHVAFLDPFSLGALDFNIISSLAELRRIDMLIHVSVMDLQRNLDKYLGDGAGTFDTFAPGWRERVNLHGSQQDTRRQVIEYWRELVFGLGKRPSAEMNLIRGSNGQNLYWLLLAADNELAHRFWKVATHTGQGRLF